MPSRDRSWKKTACSGWADMCDDIDTIIEMEKKIPNSRKTSSVMQHTPYTAKGKSVLPPDFLRIALHNTSTAQFACEHNIKNSQRELPYCSCPVYQGFSHHKSMASLLIQAGLILKCFLVTVYLEQEIQGNNHNLTS